MIDDNENNIEIHVGEKFDDVSKRVISAWYRAESGEKVSEKHISFVSWDLLSRVMTNRRYELLTYVHNHNPVENIATLARDIHRDYKRVYEDVSILESAGLLTRSENGTIRADYNRIDSSIHFPGA